MEHGQPATDLRREREQVKLGADLAVVAPLRLSQQVQVVILGLPRFPCGAVDPLQLRVLLAAPPVGAAGAASA
jgi:hypothetical protein